jgi:hypothetical protein
MRDAREGNKNWRVAKAFKRGTSPPTNQYPNTQQKAGFGGGTREIKKEVGRSPSPSAEIREEYSLYSVRSRKFR